MTKTFDPVNLKKKKIVNVITKIENEKKNRSSWKLFFVIVLFLEIAVKILGNHGKKFLEIAVRIWKEENSWIAIISCFSRLVYNCMSYNLWFDIARLIFRNLFYLTITSFYSISPQTVIEPSVTSLTVLHVMK